MLHQQIAKALRSALVHGVCAHREIVRIVSKEKKRLDAEAQHLSLPSPDISSDGLPTADGTSERVVEGGKTEVRRERCPERRRVAPGQLIC